MLFVPAKQIERAYAQTNVPNTQPKGSIDQVANQIAQMVTKYNPTANTLAISKILVDIYIYTQRQWLRLVWLKLLMQLPR